MTTERPSPFTIPEPALKFAHGPPAEPIPPQSMTVGGLIINLTIFADFYERASADIESAEAFEKPRAMGNRDVYADDMQRQFRTTNAIDRVRTHVLSQYGADLTIGTAGRLLGDLIRRCKLSVKAAEAMTLEIAMDRLESAVEEEEADPEADKPLLPARHSKDFRSVRWYGDDYHFSPTQAACVKVMWEEWEKGTPDLGQETILEHPEVEAESKRLVDVFKGHPAWGKMIVKGRTAGSYRLAGKPEM
jgi:hypothetical protein